jgi:hypothetical protein
MWSVTNTTTWVIFQRSANSNWKEARRNSDCRSRRLSTICGDCSCYQNTGESWLIDSGCANHMTYDVELFKDFNNDSVSKVKICNG